MAKVALIGAGYWGSKIANSLSTNKNIEEVSIIDVRNGETIDSIPQGYNTAIIATPLWDHYETTSSLLKRGFDCYVEKPMAETADQCLELEKLSGDQVLMVGHIFLYHPAMDYIKENLSRIGTVRHITSERLNWGIYQKKTTPLHSLLPHDISILFELLGTDAKLENAMGNDFNNTTQPDYVNFNLKFNSGVTANVVGSWYWPERVRKLTIIGTEGMIIWDDSANFVKIFNGTVVDGRLTELTITEEHIPDLSVTPLERELNHFIDCVVNRTTPKSDVKNAITVAKLIDEVSTYLR